MKSLAAIALFIIVFASVAHADLSSWNIDVSLNEDKSSDWNVSLISNETMLRSDYFVLADVRSYTVLADGSPVQCRLEKDYGTSIICDNISANNVTYIFTTGPIVNTILQNFMMFTYRFPATQLTQRYSVTVRLPVGNVLAEPGRIQGVGLKPFEPQDGEQGSDGRRISITWTKENPGLGYTLDMYAVYEQPSTIEMGIFAAIVGGLIIAFFIVVLLFFRRGPVANILPVLNESERKVVQILLREKGTVDQRVIVKETDFSKAKVSRILNDLQSRGIITKTLKGRKNLIELKKTIKPEKMASKQNIEKKGEKLPFKP